MRDRNDAGQYADGIDPDTVTDVFDAREDLARPVTASDVVDELGIARRTAHNKLNALVERGELETRKIGARGRVWWRPIPADESDEFDAADLQGDPSTTLDDTDADDAGRTSAPGDATETPAGEQNAESGRTRDESDAGGPDALTTALAELDTTDARRDAVRACVEHLREHGTGQRRDFLDAVYPDHAAGFGSEGGWWNKIGKQYLKAVADVYAPVTPPAKEGSHTWRWDP